MSPCFDKQAIKEFIERNEKGVYIPPSSSNGDCRNCIVHNTITVFGMFKQLKAKYDSEMKHGFWSTCALDAYPIYRELGGTKEDFYNLYIRQSGGLACGHITKAILELLKKRQCRNIIKI